MGRDRAGNTGVHDFRWVYSKDYSESVGEDRAFIQVEQDATLSASDGKPTADDRATGISFGAALP